MLHTHVIELSPTVNDQKATGHTPAFCEVTMDDRATLHLRERLRRAESETGHRFVEITDISQIPGSLELTWSNIAHQEFKRILDLPLEGQARATRQNEMFAKACSTRNLVQPKCRPVLLVDEGRLRVLLLDRWGNVKAQSHPERSPAPLPNPAGKPQVHGLSLQVAVASPAMAVLKCAIFENMPNKELATRALFAGVIEEMAGRLFQASRPEHRLLAARGYKPVFQPPQGWYALVPGADEFHDVEDVVLNGQHLSHYQSYLGFFSDEAEMLEEIEQDIRDRLAIPDPDDQPLPPLRTLATMARHLFVEPIEKHVVTQSEAEPQRGAC